MLSKSYRETLEPFRSVQRSTQTTIVSGRGHLVVNSSTAQLMTIVHYSEFNGLCNPHYTSGNLTHNRSDRHLDVDSPTTARRRSYGATPLPIISVTCPVCILHHTETHFHQKQVTPLPQQHISCPLLTPGDSTSTFWSPCLRRIPSGSTDHANLSTKD